MYFTSTAQPAPLESTMEAVQFTQEHKETLAAFGLDEAKQKALADVMVQVAANLKARGITSPSHSQIEQETVAVLTRNIQICKLMLGNPGLLRSYSNHVWHLNTAKWPLAQLG